MTRTDTVGADAHIGPLGTLGFAEGFRVSAVTSARADVGIGSYTVPGSLIKNQNAGLTCILERKKRL